MMGFAIFLSKGNVSPTLLLFFKLVKFVDKERHDISLRHLGRDISRVWDNNQIMNEHYA